MRFEYIPPWDSWKLRSPASVLVDIEGIDPHDHIVRAISSSGSFYEIELLEYLFTRGPRGGLFIDVGAHIGNHSVYFAKFLADCVVAVEPSPVVGPLLRRNIAANDLRDVMVFDCAVGAEQGYARHYLPPGFEQNTGAARIAPLGPQMGCDGGVRVPTQTLDSLVLQIEATRPGMEITLVKLDVEGMELDALLGARRLLAEHRPQLVVELATPESEARVVEFLGSIGYHAVGRFCATPTFHFIDRRVHALRPALPGLVARVGNSWQRGRLRGLRARLRPAGPAVRR